MQEGTSTMSKIAVYNTLPTTTLHESSSEKKDKCVNDATETTSDTTNESSSTAKLVPNDIDIIDPLGLLQSKHLAAAISDTNRASRRRRRKHRTEEEKLEANRKSAADSRLRKKMTLIKLQEKVTVLRKENSALHLENEILKKKVFLSHALRTKNLQGYGVNNTRVQEMSTSPSFAPVRPSLLSNEGVFLSNQNEYPVQHYVHGDILLQHHMQQVNREKGINVLLEVSLEIGILKRNERLIFLIA